MQYLFYNFYCNIFHISSVDIFFAFCYNFFIRYAKGEKSVFDRDRKNSKLFYAMRGAISFLWFFFIFKLTSVSTSLHAYAVSSKDVSIFTGLPEYVIFLTVSISAVFIFNSVVLMFSTFDKDEIESFLENDTESPSFKDAVKLVFTTPHFLTELITTLTLISLTALIGGFSEIGSTFFDGTHRGGWFPLVIITPICFVLFLSAKYEARRYWHYLNRINDIEKVTLPKYFYKRFLLIFFLYPLVFPYSPLLVFFAYSFASIIISIFGALTLIGLVVITISLLLFLFIIPKLKSRSRKKRFIRSVNEIATQVGYSVSWHSDNSDKRIFKFNLTYGEKEFNCLVIGTKRRGVPLVFTSVTNAYFEHRLGTEEHHISISRHIDFFLHGNGTKIIIVNPSPKHVFVTDGIRMQRLSSSDRIWNHTIHDDVSFLGAMERKCLDKFSVSNE